MGWRDWFSYSGAKATKSPFATVASDARASTEGKLLECTPALMAQTFLTWVITDLEGTKQTLKIIAKENLHFQGHNATDEELEELLRRQLSLDKETELFRQLCFFYDALWYKILLPDLINRTGRVPPDTMEAYRQLVRQKCMEVIATAAYLPMPWRDWSADASSEELKTDYQFYMHGVIPASRQEEFDMILNFTQARDNGPIFEMLAWLHMRTREIVGLVDKKEGLITHMLLWKSQASFTCELIEKFMRNVVPISE